MELEIRLFAGLKCNNEGLECFGKNNFKIVVPDGIKIKELHQLLELSTALPLVNLINGLAKPIDLVLKDNDRVGIFPPVGGG